LLGVCVKVGFGGAAVSTVHVRESAALSALEPCFALTWKE
jgi:hypothetical protein